MLDPRAAELYIAIVCHRSDRMSGQVRRDELNSVHPNAEYINIRKENAQPQGKVTEGVQTRTLSILTSPSLPLLGFRYPTSHPSQYILTIWCFPVRFHDSPHVNSTRVPSIKSSVTGCPLGTASSVASAAAHCLPHRSQRRPCCRCCLGALPRLRRTDAGEPACQPRMSRCRSRSVLHRGQRRRGSG